MSHPNHPGSKHVRTDIRDSYTKPPTAPVSKKAWPKLPPKRVRLQPPVIPARRLRPVPALAPFKTFGVK